MFSGTDYLLDNIEVLTIIAFFAIELKQSPLSTVEAYQDIEKNVILVLKSYLMF